MSNIFCGNVRINYLSDLNNQLHICLFAFKFFFEFVSSFIFVAVVVCLSFPFAMFK